MSTYFGKAWPSGICDDGERVATPVGQLCVLCEETVVIGDRGSFMAGGQPVHRECSLRSVIGGIEHLTAGPHEVGTCYDGSTLSYRDSALAAWDWQQTHG